MATSTDDPRERRGGNRGAGAHSRRISRQLLFWTELLLGGIWLAGSASVYAFFGLIGFTAWSLVFLLLGLDGSSRFLSSRLFLWKMRMVIRTLMANA
jgi:hypothetical protein